MKRIAIVIGLMLLASTMFGAAKSWTGYVTDAKCAATGKGGADHAGCAEKCIKGGSDSVLVTGGKVVKIANQDKVKGHAGHNVTVTGKLDGDTLTINTLKMVAEKKAGDEKKKKS